MTGVDLKFSLHDPKPGDRHCGGCTACCKILPTKEIEKPALTRCPHQRFGKGCAIYHRRPMSCRLWSCAWLQNDDTADLSRPDRSHLVIDSLPDYVTLKFGDKPDQHLPVVQVWCDPLYPNAHRDPAFRRYVERRGADGAMTLIRFGSNDAFVLCPPNMAHDGKWHEQHSDLRRDKVHNLMDVMEVLNGGEPT